MKEIKIINYKKKKRIKEITKELNQQINQAILSFK